MTVGDVVRQAMQELSAEDQEAISAVRFLVKSRPDAQDLERGCTPDQMAAFYGVGRELGVQGLAELPDPSPAEGEITIFLDNLAPATPERIRVAFLHEVGHALGWDEEEIRASGFFLEGKGDESCCGF